MTGNVSQALLAKYLPSPDTGYGHGQNTWRVLRTVPPPGPVSVIYANIRHLYGVCILCSWIPTNDNGLILFHLSFPCWSTIFNLNLLLIKHYIANCFDQ